MEVEYTVSTGMKVFYGVIAVVLAGLALLFFNMDHTKAGPVVLLIPILFSIFSILIVTSQLKRMIILSTDRIVKVSIWGRKELPTSNIKGIRIGEKVIYIEPDSPSYPKLTINNYSDLGSSDELKSWLTENFKDLDAADLAEEQDRLLNDGRLGATKEEREATITQSKWMGWSYMAIGMFAGLMCIPFDKKPAVIIFLIVYPLIGILIMALNKGLIKFISSTRRSVYSFTALGLFTPAFVLCLTGSLGYDIYDFHNAFLPAIVICLATAVLIYITGFNKDMPTAGQAIGMLLISAVYGFGCVVQVNCLFDKSAPQAVHTSVYDKHKNYNKREHYYLSLNPFSPGKDQEETEVSEGTYDKYNVGDNIEVELKKGLLNIPWYYLPADY